MFRIKRILYRMFRTAKDSVLKTNNPLILRMFFSIQRLLELMLHRARNLSREEIEQRDLYREQYLKKYSKGAPFELVAEQLVAEQSDDHKSPRGTIFDNSLNLKFNQRLYSFMKQTDLKLMDLGCSGGGFVKSIIDDGHLGIGLEGSDTSKKLLSGEWYTCPYHLFTCDITKPYKILDINDSRVLFDIITCWEVLEHIPETILDQMIGNIKDNLREKGYFIASVATFPDANPLTGAVYHVTLKPRSWWEDKFRTFGLTAVEDHPFLAEDFVRGNGSSVTEWHPSDNAGFHLVLQLTG